MEAQDHLRGLLVAGMTQAAIALETKIPQPTISRILNGRVKDVPSKRGRKIQALWELKGGTASASTQDRRVSDNPPPPDLERRDDRAAAITAQAEAERIAANAGA